MSADEKINRVITHLKNAYRQVEGNPIDERKFVGYAIANALAYQVAIPTERLDQPFDRYYDDNVVADVKTAVGAFNEVYPVDIQFVRAMIKMIFQRRYKTVWEPCSEEGLDVMVDTIKYKMVDVGLGEIEDIPGKEVCGALKEGIKALTWIMTDTARKGE